ncbi:MAG: hypothetical protein WB421_22275, partial [Terriglobales bacterium]
WSRCLYQVINVINGSKPPNRRPFMSQEDYNKERSLWMAKVTHWKSKENDPDLDNTVDLYVIKPVDGETDERDPSVRDEPFEDVRLMLVADNPADLKDLNRIEGDVKRPDYTFGAFKKREIPLAKIDLHKKTAQEMKRLFESDKDYHAFLQDHASELVNMHDEDALEYASLAKKWMEDVKVNEYGVVEMKHKSKRAKPVDSVPVPSVPVFEGRVTRSMTK